MSSRLAILILILRILRILKREYFRMAKVSSRFSILILRILKYEIFRMASSVSSRLARQVASKVREQQI